MSASTATVTGSGTLKDANGNAVAGVSVTITRNPSVGSPVALPAVTTAADGSFSFTDTVPDGSGSYTYSASFAGNTVDAASSATSNSVASPAIPTTITIQVTI